MHEETPMPLRSGVAVAVLASLLASMGLAAQPVPRTEDSSLYLEGDRDAEKLLESARAAARGGQWRQAIEAYQRVAELSGKGGAQPLVVSSSDPTVYLPIQDAAALELASLPGAALDLYREGQDAAAKALFERGLAAKDAALLATVAQRYLASSWGDDALAALGSVAFERGDHVGALAAWERLVAAHASPSVSLASLRARMWVCRRALGQSRAADALAELLRARHGAEMLQVGGKPLAVRDFLSQQVPLAVSEPLGEWPALGGDSSHARVARGIEEVGELAWSFSLPSAAEDARREGGGQALPVALQPVAVGDGLFVADHGAACALRAETGRPVWLYPDAPEPGPAPALDETIHAPACDDGRLFVRLGDAVAAFDASTGRLLWRRTFIEEKQEAKEEKPGDQEEPKEKPEPKKRKKKEGKSLGAKTTILLTPPVVAGPRVFVGLTHLGEEARASVVALDAISGNELWRSFVSSRSIPAFLGLGATPCPPAVSGGTVYLPTSLGTVAALDVATGSIRWVHRYASFPSQLRHSLVERRQRWANNPALVANGYVFVAPQDASRLLALDAVSGSVAWWAPREGARYLVGVEGGRLFLAGTKLQALDALTGKRVWSVDLPDEAAGRPALGSGRLYVPAAKALLAARTGDGALTTARLWQRGEGPGNLTLTDRALVVASSDRLWAFSDWATARERLERALKLDASDPAVPLAFGRHEAHRGAYAAAIPRLEEALRLAGAKKDSDAARRARLTLFECYRALGDPDSLGKALACAAGPDEKAGLLVPMARSCEQQGRYAEAIATYQKIMEECGGARCRMEGGLTVVAQAMATGEIDRLIRERRRQAYAPQEAEAGKQLAAAKAEAELEAVVRRFPNSAAAEQALLRRLSAPNAQELAPHLAALASLLGAEAASEARSSVEAKLKTLHPAVAGQAPLARRWQVQTRIAHRRAEVVELPGTPPGHLYFATARRAFDRSLPFDGIECRRLETGQLVWDRELGDWDGLAVVAGGHLVLAAFDRVIALDPASGVERWVHQPDGEAPVGDLLPDGPGPVVGRRRVERRRVVGLAADKAAVYAGLAGGEAIALSLAEGKKLWTRQLDARALLARGLFAHGDMVCVCAESPGAVHLLDARDGSGKAAIAFKPGQGALRLARITDRPAWVAGQGRLYVIVDDREVHAIDLAKGREMWTTEMDFSISRVLADDEGEHCYVLPDSFVHEGQIVSLHPRTGAVRRRRSVLTASLVDAELAPGVLYVAKKDNDQALVVQALDPGDLSERWQTAPLQLFRASGIARGNGFLAVTGRHAEQQTAVVIHAGNGKVAGDVVPKGAENLSAAMVGDLLILGTDRGIHAFGPSQPEMLERQIAALAARVEAGDRSALAGLASALYQRKDEERAIRMLAGALSDESLPDADYAVLKDLLNSLRESLASRRPAVLTTAYMASPPNIDGAPDEPWAADCAARLHGPAFIDEIQGVPISEARWRSPSDLSAVLYTGWDARHFYFAVDVSDDVHRTYTSQRDNWIGDGLIISIDAENDGGYGYRFAGKDLLLTLALTRKDERRDEDEGDEPSGEYRVRIKDDNSGAIYEVAIPWEYLGIQDPRPGLRFGFNVTVTDDDGDRAVKAISWTPGMILDRDRGLMVRGFTPALFGDVLLTGPQAGPRPLWRPASERGEQIRVRRIRPPKEK
jgi:outer membrane protein assembly factor BamB/tetratricopeptide (TPR) repeat protein